ncbi:MAG: isocitrate lyase/phosphoenolpyruvate mutase family protein [Acidimicrobiales bacterium]
MSSAHAPRISLWHARPDGGRLARLQSFAEVGADCLYAPGPRDLASLSVLPTKLVGQSNALIGMGSSLTMADAESIGVRRVSVGASLYRATMATFDTLVRQLVTTGSFAVEQSPISGDDFEALLDR